MSRAVRKARFILAIATIAIAIPQSGFGAAPDISRLSPTALAPGKTTTLKLDGAKMAGVVDLWTSFDSDITVTNSSGSELINLTLPSNPTTGVGAIRLVTTNGLSAYHLTLIDAMPSGESAATNHSLPSAQTLPHNTAIDGVCEELRSDYFRIRAKKGERVTIEAVAQRIGSPFDPLLRLLDAEGREIALNDDAEGLGVDAKIEVLCRKTADYYVELRDTGYAGGARHRYRLRFGKPLPAPLPFVATHEVTQLTSPLNQHPQVQEEKSKSEHIQRIPLPADIHGSFAKPGERDIYEFEAKKGDRVVFTGETRSLGSQCDLFLVLQSVDGTQIAESNATAGDEGALTNRFTADGLYQLVVEELNKNGGTALRYQIAVESALPAFTASTEIDRISGPSGDALEFEVKAERHDYDGAITLDAEGLPPNFKLENNVIAAKTNATKLKIVVPAELPMGDYLPFTIIAHATIDNKPRTERVSTLPALRAAFPMLRYPPNELDGLLMLSISESKSASPKPPSKKKRK